MLTFKKNSKYMYLHVNTYSVNVVAKPLSMKPTRVVVKISAVCLIFFSVPAVIAVIKRQQETSLTASPGFT